MADDRMTELMGMGAGADAASAESAFMAEFFQEVAVVKSNIASIEEATKKIEALSNKSQLSTTTAADKENSDTLNKIIKETNAKAQQSHKWLQSTKKKNDEMKGDPNRKESELKIRQNMHGTLARKFMDSMKEYQACQVKYKADMKKKVTRQVKVVNPDATDDQINEVISTGDTSQVFRSAIMAGPHSQIVDAARDVQAFYKDVLQLERSMNDLQQMFRDMALLVDMQGEMLDQIEFQVKEVKTNVDKGNKELVSAIEHAKSARKKKCCLVVVLIVILIIVSGVGGSIGSGLLKL